MRKVFNQLAISLYSLFVRVFPGTNVQRAECKKIVVFFPQQLGDALLFSDTLQQLSMIYPKDKGYSIYFIADSSVNKFLKIAVDVSREINFVDFDKDKLFSEFTYYKAFYNQYFMMVHHIVVPNPSNSGLIIGIVCNSLHKTIAINTHQTNMLYRILLRGLSEDDVLEHNQLMVFELHKLLLNKLGNRKYSSHMPFIRNMPHKSHGRYCVLHPGASLTYKVWPIEKYLCIADYLTSVLEYDVLLCGDSSDVKYGKYIEEQAKLPYRIKNYIGKTSYDEWIGVIQGAELVVGSDSASIHIVAASGVPSIVICGLYDKGIFFPYVLDEHFPGKVMPKCLIKEMKCCSCRTRSYTGAGNKDCYDKVKKGEAAICVSAISEEDVQKIIYKTLNMSERRDKT